MHGSFAPFYVYPHQGIDNSIAITAYYSSPVKEVGGDSTRGQATTFPRIIDVKSVRGNRYGRLLRSTCILLLCLVGV